MNTIFQLIRHLYLSIKERFSPPQNQCAHCDVPTPSHVHHDLSGIRSPIKFKGKEIGMAYNLGHLGKGQVFASSLVFNYDDLQGMFLNSCAIAESQTLPFDLDCHGLGTGYYLVSSDDPIYAKYRGAQQVWLNRATLEPGDDA